MSAPFADFLARSRSSILDDESPVTGSELVETGTSLAATWGETGLRPGERVGLWLPNGHRYLETLAACAVGGFVAVSVNTRWSRAEVDDLLGRSGAVLLRTADGEERLASGVQPLTAGADNDQPFLVFTTSGTTSRPKMVLHGQQSIVEHALDAGRACGYGPDRPVLAAMPLCGVFGLTSFTAALATDAPIVMPSAIDPPEIASLIEQRRIWALNASDDLFHRLLATDRDLSSLRLGGYARFNTSLDGIVARAAERGMNLTGLYGMSEVQALFSLRDPTAPLDQRQRAGGTVVSAKARARVVDDELQVRGSSLFSGYLTEGGEAVDAALTAAHFTDDGWFRTGDLASMDEPVDGRDTFTYRTRMGDGLRLGGFLVAPAEIEAAIVGYPGVDGAQVVAVDRPTGARPVAFVTGTSPDDGAFDEAAIIDHCRSQLARYKVPVRVIPINAFPTTASANGTKIQRVKLREMALAALHSEDATGRRRRS